jgi:ABC-type branched-subunit amino acid transport system ATPase component/ABC-type branched-subunit amino acid transport system permease subunit
MSGLPASIPFIVLFVGLLVIPRRRLIERWQVRARPLPRSWEGPPRVRLTAGAVILAFFAVAPIFAGTHQFAMTSWLIFTLLFASLGLLVKTSGQVSLCHFGLAAVGAAAFGQLQRAGVPWAAALVAAAFIAVPVGAIVAFSAIRLSGIYLAVATYGFAILLQQLLYGTSIMFQPTLGAGLQVRRPGIDALRSERGYYYLVLAIVVVVTIALVALERARFGRLLRALSDSEFALETHGTTASVLKLSVFALSSFVAGLAGALLGGLYSVVDGSEFSPSNSLSVFVVLMLIFAASPWYAVIGAASLTIIPALIDVGGISRYLAVMFGVGAILLAYQMDHPPAVPDRFRHWVERRFARPDTIESAPSADAGVDASPASPRPRPSAEGGLAVTGLTIQYSGLVAVQDFSFVAPANRITGLIGPNGAGKTSTFNAASGTLRPSSGRVVLNGRDVTDLGVAARARLGLGRTFQRVELWESLTVLDNVRIAVEAGIAGRNARAQLFGSRQDRAEIDRRTSEAIELAGIGSLTGLIVGSLSTGQRRLVELARCLSGRFDMLLLDEPSSGLDPNETARFGAALKTVVDTRGVGILLVEHDMSLVTQVCEYIYVLDFGRHIFDGTSAEVAASSVVRAAYLGDDVTMSDAVAAATAGQADSRC